MRIRFRFRTKILAAFTIFTIVMALQTIANSLLNRYEAELKYYTQQNMYLLHAGLEVNNVDNILSNYIRSHLLVPQKMDQKAFLQVKEDLETHINLLKKKIIYLKTLTQDSNINGVINELSSSMNLYHSLGQKILQHNDQRDRSY